MALRGLPREKVLATVVHLLETTLIRVGNDDYARQNKSYGLTTLRNRHVKVEGAELRFQFKGKSGKTWRLQLKDRRVAKIVRACQDLPGQHLFQYIDDDGELRDVTSADVNAYLREITGRDITAKDFRTWAGTVLAALALQEFERVDSAGGAEEERACRDRAGGRAPRQHADDLPQVLHPSRGAAAPMSKASCCCEIEHEVEAELRRGHSRLRPDEAAVLALLRGAAGAHARRAAGRQPVGAEGPQGGGAPAAQAARGGRARLRSGLSCRA